MTSDSHRRWLILGGLLSATLAAAAWVGERGDDREPGQIAENSTRGQRTQPPRRKDEPPQLNLDKLKDRRSGDPTADPFALPAPPAPPKNARRPAAVATAPPPLPSAPPVPYVYMGKLLSGPDTAVFLTQGERNLVVRQGDTIDSLYRVEQVADSAITLVYLPLEQRQTLFIGELQ